jgi:hypothetical protein
VSLPRRQGSDCTSHNPEPIPLIVQTWRRGERARSWESECSTLARQQEKGLLQGKKGKAGTNTVSFRNSGALPTLTIHVIFFNLIVIKVKDKASIKVDPEPKHHVMKAYG